MGLPLNKRFVWDQVRYARVFGSAYLSGEHPQELEDFLKKHPKLEFPTATGEALKNLGDLPLWMDQPDAELIEEEVVVQQEVERLEQSLVEIEEEEEDFENLPPQQKHQSEHHVRFQVPTHQLNSSQPEQTRPVRPAFLQRKPPVAKVYPQVSNIKPSAFLAKQTISSRKRSHTDSEQEIVAPHQLKSQVSVVLCGRLWCRSAHQKFRSCQHPDLHLLYLHCHETFFKIARYRGRMTLTYPTPRSWRRCTLAGTTTCGQCSTSVTILWLHHQAGIRHWRKSVHWLLTRKRGQDHHTVR